jgi:non-specific serine/threonine protein kinase
VDEKRSHDPQRPWRALYDWFRRGIPPSHAGGDVATDVERTVPDRIGRYAVVRKLGEGGMGVVYAARDARLERTVAVKVMSLPQHDETARRRFWREARAAASVNHPNVCQLYEIGEDDGRLFIAMELLEGESLAERLRRGAMSVSDTTSVGLGILAALSALHARGIVHRDLKPSNVILTPHGVKLLDFGLARATSSDSAPSPGAAIDLTRTGMLVGTPGYIAPERVNGEPLDARSDLFAVGAVLFEMLAGRPAFRGGSVVEILHAVLHEQPPALTGSPAAAAMDRVIRRALAKAPSERPQSADDMAEALRAAAGRIDGTESRTVVRALTRLVVLPFRVLRPDAETDFLAFSLPDAIATSLSGLDSLIVRSSATAARFAGEIPDLKALAADVDVDRVVLGTLLRSGDQLRATAQLVDAPGGALLTSETVQVPLGDLFQLQDELARRVVDALSLPLVGGRATPSPAAPPDDRAYLLYLQANEVALRYDQLPRARELYERCLEVDPTFAPAWARLGRCHWMIGRYVGEAEDSDARAVQALGRALELNPRLALAHKFYAILEAGTGRGRAALGRLLGQAERSGTDPELFAGLVQVCRYCGLFEEAVAAHEEARRLDPNVPTSLGQTLLVKGDLDRLLGDETPRMIMGGDAALRAVAAGLSGSRDAARRAIVDLRREADRLPAFQSWADLLLAWLDRSPADMIARLSAFRGRTIMEDPEAVFQCGWLLCDAGGHERGLEFLRRAVQGGYHAAPTLSWSRAFDAVRNDPAFGEIRAQAEAGRAQALAVFRERGGERLLGR